MSTGQFRENSITEAELSKHLDGSLLKNLDDFQPPNQSSTKSPDPKQRTSATTPSLLLSPEPSNSENYSINNNNLLSPATNSSMALLSPPGSRYAFENTDPSIPSVVSPLLGSNQNPLIGAFNNSSIQRPLSAQDFNLSNVNNSESFDAFRPFSAQGGGSNFNQNFNIPERPLSSMEIDSMTFKNDVVNFINWINSLNSNQHRVVIDNLFSNLPADILNYARNQLDTAGFTPYNESSSSRIVSPQPLYQNYQEQPTLDSVLTSSGLHQPNPIQPETANNLQRALSPNFPSFDRTALLQDIGFNRPRSADPYNAQLLKNNKQQQQQQQQRQQLQHNEYDLNKTPSKSRTSRFDEDKYDTSHRSFDITNLAQQLTQTPIKLSDYNNANSLKLSALSTINNRAQLDSSKKRHDERGRNFNNNNNNNNQYWDENYRSSTSVPPPQRVNYYESIINSPSNIKHRQQRNDNQDQLSRLASLNNATKNLSLNDEFHTPNKSQSNHTTVKSPAINPKQITNIKLLNDIPAWLKSLRLHKYTNALQDIPWTKLIYYDDSMLENQGVSAMGARGKLLKAFDVVKQHYEDGLIKE